MMEVAEVMAQSRNYRMKRRDGRGIQEVSSNSCSMSTGSPALGSRFDARVIYYG